MDKEKESVKFYGEKFTKKGTVYYHTTIDGHRFCTDFTEFLLTKSEARKLDDWYDCESEELAKPHQQFAVGTVPSWGDCGTGSQRLALALLALTSNKNRPWNVVYSDCTDAEWRRIRRIVRKYYRQFAQQIIAHLPDKWTLSVDEVKAWVHKQEAQRKANGKAKKTKRRRRQTRR